MSRASVSVTFAVGSLRWPDHFACLRSGSVAEHSLNAPCPLRDRPCRAVQRQPGETLLHFREVQRLCCDHYLPFRLHKFSPQRATTRGTPTRSQKSRNGVRRICGKFHQYPDSATAVPSPAPRAARDLGNPPVPVVNQIRAYREAQMLPLVATSVIFIGVLRNLILANCLMRSGDAGDYGRKASKNRSTMTAECILSASCATMLLQPLPLREHNPYFMRFGGAPYASF